MSGSVTKRLVRGVSATAFGTGVTAVVQLVSVPLFLWAWGVAGYGDWLLLSTIPAYFGMSDIGFCAVAGNEMSMRAARGDRGVRIM